MINKFLTLTWKETRLAKRLDHRRRFRGLGIDDFATVFGPGALSYGKGAAVGPHSMLVLEPGSRLRLDDACYVGRYVELAPGRQIRLGRSSSIQDRCVVLGDVEIGAYSVLAYNVYISSGNHVFDWRPGLPVKVQDLEAPADYRRAAPVVIEEDCWLGNNVFIRAGVRVGRGAVVGANSVVTRDVPPYTVVAGTPARVLRKRLEYAPPTSIRFDAEEALPYFHGGFCLLGPELQAAKQAGGLLAPGDFSVVLNAADCRSLRLRARSEGGGSPRIVYGGQGHAIAGEFADYEFPLQAGGERHDFAVEGTGTGVRIGAVSAS